MANGKSDGKVKIDVDLEKSKFEKSLDDIEKESNSAAERIVSDTQNKTNKILTMSEAYGTKFTAAVTAPILAAGVGVGKLAMDYDSALTSIQQKTGATVTEMDGIKESLNNVFSEGFGENFEDVGNAIADVKAQMQDLNGQDLENVTQKAIAFRDTFGVEVKESIRTVNSLMKGFGVSSDEAFDLMTKGMQSGLDFSDEFLDTIKEYSPQFKGLGLSAEDMFAIFEQGSKNGAWNLDKIGDAVKEFGIRVKDGSATTAEGFAAIGLNADEMSAKFAKGGESAREAFTETIQALKNMDDPLQQNIAGVNLFGTMWEDLGAEVVLSMGDIENGAMDASGAMDELLKERKESPQQQLKELKNNLMLLGASIGEEVLPMFNKLVEGATEIVEDFSEMDEGTKKVIVTLAALAASAGPAMVTINKISGAYASLKEVPAAIDKITGKTNVLQTASTKLFSVLASNPYAVLAISAGALAVGIYKIVDGMNEELNAAQQANIERQKLITNAQAENNELDIQYRQLQNLAEVENKTAGQKQLMQQYVENLNGSVEGLNLSYDAENDKLNMTTEALYKKIQAQKESALADAYLQKSKEAMQDYADAQMKQAEAEQQLLEKKQRLQELQAKGANITNAEAVEMRELGVDIANLKTKIGDLGNAQNEYIMESTRARNEIAKQTGAWQDLLEKAGKAGSDLPKELINGINTGKYAIPQTVEELNKMIEFTKAVEEAGASGKKVTDKLAQKLLSGEISIDQAIKELNESAKNEMNKLPPEAEKTGKQTANKIGTGINSGRAKVASIAKQVMQNAKKNAGSVDYSSVGRNAIDGVVSGIREKTYAIENAMVNAAEAALRAAENKLDINSPSRVMRDEVGYNIALGIAEGIEQGKTKIRISMANAVSAAKDAYHQALENFNEDVKATMNQLDLFSMFEFKEVSSEDLIANLDSQVKAFEEYQNAISTLESRAINKDLLEDLKEKGVGSVNEIKAIAEMSEYELQLYNKLYEAKKAFAEEMNQESLQTEVDAIKEDFTNAMELIEKQAKDKSKLAKDGMYKNFKDAKDDITQLMNSLANYINSSLASINASIAATKSELASVQSEAASVSNNVTNNTVVQNFNNKQTSPYEAYRKVVRAFED